MLQEYAFKLKSSVIGADRYIHHHHHENECR
jgi:hypothetical protein